MTETATRLEDVLLLLRDLRDLLRDLRDHSRQPAELLSREGVAAMLAVGVSTFDRLKAAGRVGPRPLELAGVKFDRNEVEAWIRHRDQAGELLDAKSWPPVWQALQPKSKTR